MPTAKIRAPQAIRRDPTTWTSANRPTEHKPGAPPSSHAKANTAMSGLKEGMRTPGDITGANVYISKMAGHGADKGPKVGSSTDAANLAYAGGAIAGFGLALDVSKAVQVFMTETEPTVRFSVALGLAGSAFGTAKSMAAVAQAAEGGKEKASAATNTATATLGTVTSMIGAVKSGYDAVVHIVDALEKAGDLDDKEKANRSLVIVKESLEAAKGVIDTINGLWATCGTVTGPMLQAAPGLGIAINVIDVISNGVNLGYSAVAWGEMRDDKRSAKQRLQQAGILASKKAKTRWGHPSLKQEATQIVDGVERLMTVDDQYDDAKDYLLLRNLQRVSAKRIQRATLNISTTLPAIAGDIAILSGAGAGVGAGLKGASGGVKLGAMLVRMGKQAYHDKKGDSKSTENKLKMYDGMIARMLDNLIKANEIPLRTTVNGWTDPDEVAVKEVAQERALRALSASGMTEAKMAANRPTSPRDKVGGEKLYKAWVAALKER